MRANLLIIFCLLFAGAFSQAQIQRCSKVDSYSSPCPTLKPSVSLAYGERYKSVSGTCGNGSPKTITVSYCSSKSLLATKLSHACVMARQCGLARQPIPMPKEPIPFPQPPKLPPEEPTPFPPPKLPPEEPPPVSKPVTITFKAQLLSSKATLNIVSVQWINSAIIGNYCGTGTNYIHFAKLDKSIPENAAFFASYSPAAMQSMNVTLVCRAQRRESSALDQSGGGDRGKTVYYVYPDGCYVSASSAAPPPPSCFIR